MQGNCWLFRCYSRFVALPVISILFSRNSPIQHGAPCRSPHARSNTFTEALLLLSTYAIVFMVPRVGGLDWADIAGFMRR